MPVLASPGDIIMVALPVNGSIADDGSYLLSLHAPSRNGGCFVQITVPVFVPEAIGHSFYSHTEADQGFFMVIVLVISNNTCSPFPTSTPELSTEADKGKQSNRSTPASADKPLGVSDCWEAKFSLREAMSNQMDDPVFPLLIYDSQHYSHPQRAALMKDPEMNGEITRNPLIMRGIA
ncbi:hypothetical protein AVEN_96082-1 [Araneus ventricosus]|uniref:Uncharacterized protein n=1 Tax=Araneus ventricosus TaxID=182803 RepID=A0A4Y2B4X1_ARAVE|nr:hypothetical protein AVEN_96082-1 [Araneus ventricosus]